MTTTTTKPTAAQVNDMDGRTVTELHFDPNTGVSFVVGLHGCTEIRYHSPMCEGDRHFCDVYGTDGTARRCLVFEDVVFAAQEPTT